MKIIFMAFPVPLCEKAYKHLANYLRFAEKQTFLTIILTKQ